MSAVNSGQSSDEKNPKANRPFYYPTAPKIGAAFAAAALGVFIHHEAPIQQARFFSNKARESSITMVPTGSKAPQAAPPKGGPDDQASGYTTNESRSQHLTEQNFPLISRASAETPRILGLPLYPVYNHESQKGLSLISSDTQKPVYIGRFPHQSYPDFQSIPPILAKSWAYVEDRHLLDPHADTFNPAINWGRTARATAGQISAKVGWHWEHSGGSTMATQAVKFRDSPNGRTVDWKEKLRQMETASIQAEYERQHGQDPAQKSELDYINTAPFSSYPFFGETIGLADAMHMWFGEDFDEMNRVLRQDQNTMNDAELARAAKFYREAFSLELSVKKPSDYLLNPLRGPNGNFMPAGDHSDELQNRIDSYLPKLVKDGEITARFAALVKDARKDMHYADPLKRDGSHDAPHEKYIQGLRLEAMKLLSEKSLYDLDRLHANVITTVDSEASARVTNTIRSLTDPEVLKAKHLTGGDLANPQYAQDLTIGYMLCERVTRPDGKVVDVVRVQTDNWSGPLNLSTGMRLQLGSSSKPFVDANLLQRVEKLHHKYAGQDTAALKAIKVPERDHVTRFVLDYLSTPGNDTSLYGTLNAMQTAERYSGNTSEVFFTGGGAHVVHNFKRDENSKIYSPDSALVYSVNASYVRIMRDVVNNIIAQDMNVDETIFSDLDNPLRKVYLERFAHFEGTQFLENAWAEQVGRNAGGKPKVPDERAKNPDQTAELLAAKSRHHGPAALAIIYNATHPNATPEDLAAFIAKEHASTKDASKYNDYNASRFNLNDRIYLSGLKNGMSLWLAEYRTKNPKATFDEAVEASAATRIEIYQWLLNPKRPLGHKHRQDLDIETMLQQEAFEVVRQQWSKWGYPFKDMVASYETAIGVSGMTLKGLSQFMSILVNDGISLPMTEFDGIQLAPGTPYEKDHRFEPPANPERVMSPELVKVLSQSLHGVVEHGTAQRISKAVKINGETVDVAGKTGTGSNKHDRTATFTAEYGGRFIATTFVGVLGPQSAHNHFTSALAVQLSKALLPDIQSVLDNPIGKTPPPQQKPPLATPGPVPAP